MGFTVSIYQSNASGAHQDSSGRFFRDSRGFSEMASRFMASQQRERERKRGRDGRYLGCRCRRKWPPSITTSTTLTTLFRAPPFLHFHFSALSFVSFLLLYGSLKRERERETVGGGGGGGEGGGGGGGGEQPLNRLINCAGTDAGFCLTNP